MSGYADITVRIFFECDLDDTRVDEVISECVYNFEHELISHIEIIEVIEH